MIIECSRCHLFWDTNDKDYCIKGEVFHGIDEHHNPPKFMMKEWKGELYFLCRKDHRSLHDKIIEILNKKANNLKFIKSEHYVWMKLSPKQKEEVTKEVYEFTKEWVKNGDTKTTTI